jgi:hypothetical protein
MRSFAVTPNGRAPSNAHGLGPALDDGLGRQHVRELAGADAEGERAEPAMGAGVAIAADDQAAGEAEAELGADDMDDALPRLVEVEQPDVAGRRLGPQRRQQIPPGLDRAGPPGRGRNRMIGRGEGQFGIVDRNIAAFEVEQAAGAAEVMQQMAIHMQQIGIIADASDDMLVPDFGQQRATVRVHDPSSHVRHLMYRVAADHADRQRCWGAG